MHPIMAEQYMRFATQRYLEDAERWRRARTVRRARKATASQAIKNVIAATMPPRQRQAPDVELTERRLMLTAGRH